MQQLNKTKSIFFHLYPGIIITLGFIVVTPFFIKYGFPPQFGILISIAVLAVPLLLVHLLVVKKQESKTSISELNGLTHKLSKKKLIFYSIGLVIFSFFIWGTAQPLNAVVAEKWFNWLPDWYAVQNITGYDKSKVFITLMLNLLLNGFLAPYIEELYFRGYLLPRMRRWGKSAFVVNAILFSLYHFWQPDIYVVLILSLLPMTYLVWKTKDLRLSILTHSLLNIIGAFLLFGLLDK